MSGSDVLIVGGGIVGLAHAYHARRAGLSVTVVEKHDTQYGASVRNFGNFWPIGQRSDNGDLDKALYGRAVYQELSEAAGFWFDPCGSWHLADTPEERAVFEEFVEKGPDAGYEVSLLGADDLAAHDHLIDTRTVRWALHSATEGRLNPRAAVPAIASWLAEAMGVRFHYDTEVQAVEPGRVETNRGPLRAERIVLCTGFEAWQFYRDHLEAENIQPCKLQMLRTRPLPDVDLHTSVATGLSCRHYKSFALCTDTLDALRRHVAETAPDLDEWGIHLLVTQNDARELVIGDSHEYGHPSPFDHEFLFDRFIELTKHYLKLNVLPIGERWAGIYLKHHDKTAMRVEPEAGVEIVNGLGGNGMTLSFGLARETVENW